MTSSQDIGRELRARRRARAVQPRTPGWDWGPRRPPQHRKAWLVLGLVVVVAVILASLPPAGAGPAAKGVGEAIPKTTTTTTTTMPPPPPPPPVLEPQALAPAPPPPAPVVPPDLSGLLPPIPQDGIQVGGHLPDWAWTEPGRLSPAGLAAMAMAVGCSPGQAVIAAAVALGESGGRTDAVGDTHLMNGVWSYSAGAWQIRGLHAEHGQGTTRDPQQLLHDMWRNARSMQEISNGCTNWQPWTIWQIGKHNQHLASTVDAVLWLRGGR
jgi:hypothetical protein